MKQKLVQKKVLLMNHQYSSALTFPNFFSSLVAGDALFKLAIVNYLQ